MNLKTYFASTGGALVVMALAGAQSVGMRLTNAAAESNSPETSFARTATSGHVTVKVAREAVIWTTTDGSAWMQHSSGTPSRLHDVAYGNCVFVAVGNEGALVTSPDGVSWTGRNSRTDERLRGIAFGNGTFVAVRYEGIVITSKEA